MFYLIPFHLSTGLDLEKLTGCSEAAMISDSNRPGTWDGLRADMAAYSVVTHEAHPPQSHSSHGEDQPCPKQLLRGLHGATSNNSGTNQTVLLLSWFHPTPRSKAQQLHPHLSGNPMRVTVSCRLSPLTLDKTQSGTALWKQCHWAYGPLCAL